MIPHSKAAWNWGRPQSGFGIVDMSIERRILVTFWRDNKSLWMIEMQQAYKNHSLIESLSSFMTTQSDRRNIAMFLLFATESDQTKRLAQKRNRLLNRHAAPRCPGRTDQAGVESATKGLFLPLWLSPPRSNSRSGLSLFASPRHIPTFIRSQPAYLPIPLNCLM